MTETVAPILEQAAPKIKLALVVESSHLPLTWQASRYPELLPIPDSFWDTRTRLVDRAFCETDKETQQLLPYNLLVNELGQIFTYSRGKGSEEKRLHSKWSIGVGGHVDGQVPEGSSLHQWMIDEAKREVEEEVGLRLVIDPDYRYFIADRMDDVGSVHLGLLAIVKVASADIGALETDMIEHGQWIDYRTCTDSEIDRLENWSQIAVRALRAGTITL